jgi:hypothetical protein
MEYGEHPEANMMLRMFFSFFWIVFGGMYEVQFGSNSTAEVPQPKTKDCQYRCNSKKNWNHFFFKLDSK